MPGVITALPPVSCRRSWSLSIRMRSVSVDMVVSPFNAGTGIRVNVLIARARWHGHLEGTARTKVRAVLYAPLSWAWVHQRDGIEVPDERRLLRVIAKPKRQDFVLTLEHGRFP